MGEILPMPRWFWTLIVVAMVSRGLPARGQGSSIMYYQGFGRGPSESSASARSSSSSSQASSSDSSYRAPRDIQSTRDPLWDQKAAPPASNWLSFRRPDYTMPTETLPDAQTPMYPDRWIYKPPLDIPVAAQPWQDRPVIPTLSWAKPAAVLPSEARPSWDRPNINPPNFFIPPAIKPSFDRPEWNQPEEVQATGQRPEYQRPQDVRPDYMRTPF